MELKMSLCYVELPIAIGSTLPGKVWRSYLLDYVQCCCVVEIPYFEVRMSVCLKDTHS